MLLSLWSWAVFDRAEAAELSNGRRERGARPGRARRIEMQEQEEDKQSLAECQPQLNLHDRPIHHQFSDPLDRPFHPRSNLGVQRLGTQVVPRRDHRDPIRKAVREQQLSLLVVRDEVDDPEPGFVLKVDLCEGSAARRGGRGRGTHDRLVVRLDELRLERPVSEPHPAFNLSPVSSVSSPEASATHLVPLVLD